MIWDDRCGAKLVDMAGLAMARVALFLGDSMAQDRVAIDQVESYLAARLVGC